MEELYIATLIIIFLAIAATVLSYLLKISIALVEIIMGIAGSFVIHGWFPVYEVSINSAWFAVLASVGALMLTFLAGSELDMSVLKKEGMKAGLIGFASYLTPTLIAQHPDQIKHFHLREWLIGLYSIFISIENIPSAL